MQKKVMLLAVAGALAAPAVAFAQVSTVQLYGTVVTNYIFADNINNTVTTSVTVTAPEAPNGAPLVLAPATPVFRTGFEEPAVGTLNFNRKAFHTELGFASNTGSGAPAPAVAALPGGVYQDAAAVVPETNKSWRAVGGASSLTTEAIGLHSSVKGVKVTMKARAFTNEHDLCSCRPFTRH